VTAVISTMTKRAYLERQNGSGVEFVDITVREFNREFWVEEVVGTTDDAGKRRGVVYPRSRAGSETDASTAFQAQIAARKSEGYVEARI